MTDDLDPYDVLQVSATADLTVIAAAYRALARVHHPDVANDPESGSRMARINAAWTVLRDPAKRSAYDRSRGLPGASSLTGDGSPAGAPARGWARAGTRQRHATGWRRGPNGEGAAGPPPGPPSGSVLPFGRHIGWSIGEIARRDPGYLEWLENRREGGRFREEIDRTLRAMGRRSRSVVPGPAMRGARGRR
jgi:curved DNA-binding protein CbpA